MRNHYNAAEEKNEGHENLMVLQTVEAVAIFCFTAIS